MKNNSPKAIAYKTLLKNKLCSPPTCEELERIIETKQFKVIPYKKYNNSEAVERLIEKLGIENEIEHNDSFIYIRNNLRFVFINSDVQDEDRCALLRHELGHILDPDFGGGNTTGSVIKKEEFANEFSYHLKTPGVWFRLRSYLSKRRAVAICLIVLIVCAGILGGRSFGHRRDEQLEPVHSYGDRYYVTSGGEKYHRGFCVTVKNRTNLTEVSQEAATEAGYGPCLLCIGEE